MQTKLRRHWLVSYDAHPKISALYGDRRQFSYGLQYSAIPAYAGDELFVFSDSLAIPTSSALPYVARGLASSAVHGNGGTRDCGCRRVEAVGRRL